MRTFSLGAACMAALVFAGCEHYDLDDLQDKTSETVDVTFNTGGDFDTPTMTRGTLTSEGVTMTDLWVLDYVDGELKQTVHQESADEDFASPTLSLTLGEHDLYFVCSAGDGATMTEAQHKIVWSLPRDTFWKHLAKNVTSNTAATQSVTLDRVATRLSIKISDAIPEDVARVTVQPSTWYCGLDWLTGNGTDARNYTSTFEVTTAMVGKTNLKFMTYGLAQESEFTTDVTVTALDADGDEVASVDISDAPQQKNRSTMFTGRLFSAGTSMSVGLNDVWGTSHQETF